MSILIPNRSQLLGIGETFLEEISCLSQEINTFHSIAAHVGLMEQQVLWLTELTYYKITHGHN